MGAGLALQANKRFENLELILGKRIQTDGNHVHALRRIRADEGSTWIASFPTKDHWKNDSSPDLIRRSAKEANEAWRSIADDEPAVFPAVGCGKGNLAFENVRSILEKKCRYRPFSFASIDLF